MTKLGLLSCETVGASGASARERMRARSECVHGFGPVAGGTPNRRRPVDGCATCDR